MRRRHREQELVRLQERRGLFLPELRELLDIKDQRKAHIYDNQVQRGRYEFGRDR